jgi:ABC-type multidrug transport system fused ATPase/permease subunit
MMMASVILRVYRYMARDWKILTLTIALLLASIALAMMIPWYVRDLLNSIMTFDVSRLLPSSLMIVILTFLEGVVAFFDRYLFETIAQRTIYRLRLDLYRHLHELSYGFYDRVDVGEIIVRITNDMDTLNGFISFATMQFLNAIFSASIALSILLSLNFELTLVAATLLPLLILIRILFDRKIFPIAEKRLEGDEPV